MRSISRFGLWNAAAVNSARWALYQHLLATGLPVEIGTGGRTIWNRARLGWPKAHWRDAVCVGASMSDDLRVASGSVLLIAAKGHGTRKMCGTNASGFPIRHRRRQKQWFGFRSGDLVQAVIPSGKHAGTHVGRIAVRNRPSFKLNGFDVHPKYLRLIQRADGYAYGYQSEGAASPTL